MPSELDTKLDALLAATEGHVPTDSEPVYENGFCVRDGAVRLYPNHERPAVGFVDFPSMILVRNAGFFRTAVILLREQLRRAQLLTPESALAMCEAKWGPHDKKLCDGAWYWMVDGKMCAILTTNDRGMSFNVAADIPGSELVGESLRTVGQLEDAIAAAKGAKDAS